MLKLFAAALIATALTAGISYDNANAMGKHNFSQLDKKTKIVKKPIRMCGNYC